MDLKLLAIFQVVLVKMGFCLQLLLKQQDNNYGSFKTDLYLVILLKIM